MSEAERPWLAPGEAARRHAPATARNREPIGDILAQVLPAAGLVLEVASGSGEHCLAFAERFPALAWQPSDPDPLALESIASWCAAMPNIRPPLRLDAMAADWPVEAADALLCVNMIHISPWEATLGLFAGGAAILPPGAPLVLYGPYRREGTETAPSNEEFDRSLKTRNPEWGLRHLEAVTAVAQGAGFALKRVVEMPANNLTLVYRRS